MNTDRGVLGFLKSHTLIYLLLKEPGRIIIDFPKAIRIANKPTYYDEWQRKSYMERLLDNLKWLFKYHEANKFYTLYGLDTVEGGEGCRVSRLFVFYAQS